jgi:hypothetical protein
MFRLSRLESNRNPARTVLHGLLRGLKIDLAVAQDPGPRDKGPLICWSRGNPRLTRPGCISIYIYIYI